MSCGSVSRASAMLAEAAAGAGPRPVAAANDAEMVVGGRRLNAAQVAWLDRAARLAAGSLEERRQAAHLVRRVEAELSAAREAEAVETDLDKAAARMAARGVEVMVGQAVEAEFVRDRNGALLRHAGELVLKAQVVRRVSRVDGLASLYTAGAISDDEKRVGDAFRDVLERAKPPVSTSEYGVRTTGYCDTGRMLVDVAVAGSAGAVVSEIKRAIADQRIWAVLEAVAGRGVSVRALGDGGDLKAANKQRLIEGLAVAKQVLSDPKWKALANQAR